MLKRVKVIVIPANNSLDLYSHKIVGWAMSDRMEAILIEKALLMAIGNRKPARDYMLMHHSDRDSQYASKSF